ncbi:MAG: LysR family transcriptional regulator [Proteobacteria bacterium]|nr:LysR family transcriptional regulator [Pseudomonadota bacterium]
MDWDNMRAFLAVARQGQFLGASRILKVNQATVARRVTALEADLRATLFERSTTGVSLTEAGRDLLVRAERMESEMLQAEAELRKQDVQLNGVVRIGAPDGFTTYFLISALKGLMDRHPGIEIQLVPMPLAVSLARREVDIAITIEEPAAGRFVARKLTDYGVGIYGSTDYLDAFGRPQTSDDLCNHRRIGYVETYAYSSALSYVSEVFAGHPSTFDCASAVGQVEAVRAGLGLGVLHHFIAATLPGIEPVLPERMSRRSYWLVIHEDVRSLGRIRATVDHIVGEVMKRRAIFLGSGS